MSFSEIVSLAITAIFIENFVLVKFWGCCSFLGVSNKKSSAVGMGTAVVLVMTMASAATCAVNQFVLIPLGLEYMRTVMFVLIIASLVQITEMIILKKLPELHRSLGIYLPLITTNCAVLGAALLCVEKDFGILKSALYGFFGGAGFALAIVLFASVRERVNFADCPKCFKGFPIALVSAALLALAFMGFQGMKI